MILKRPWCRHNHNNSSPILHWRPLRRSSLVWGNDIRKKITDSPTCSKTHSSCRGILAISNLWFDHLIEYVGTTGMAVYIQCIRCRSIRLRAHVQERAGRVHEKQPKHAFIFGDPCWNCHRKLIMMCLVHHRIVLSLCIDFLRVYPNVGS
jgi:hypothetical protein